MTYAVTFLNDGSNGTMEQFVIERSAILRNPRRGICFLIKVVAEYQLY